jgi:hypothetical protein
VINFTFYAYEGPRSYETDRFLIVLKFNSYEREQIFDDDDIPEDYIPYYFMIWIASYHDYFKGMNGDARKKYFKRIRRQFLREIQNRPIVNGEPAEHTRLDQDKFLHFSLPPSHQATPWHGHLRTNHDAWHLIYGYTGGFSEKMKMWCTYS